MVVTGNVLKIIFLISRDIMNNLDKVYTDDYNDLCYAWYTLIFSRNICVKS